MKQFLIRAAAVLLLSACGGGNMPPPPPAVDIKPDRHLMSVADAGCAPATNADGTISSANDCSSGGDNDFGSGDDGTWGNGGPPSDGDDQLPDIDQSYDYGDTPGGDGSYYAGGTGGDDGLDYLYYFHATPAGEQIAVREGCHKVPGGVVCGITGKRPDPLAEPDPLPPSNPPAYPARVEVPFRLCHLLGLYGCSGPFAQNDRPPITEEHKEQCTKRFNADTAGCHEMARFHRSHVTLKGCLDDAWLDYSNCLVGRQGREPGKPAKIAAAR